MSVNIQLIPGIRLEQRDTKGIYNIFFLTKVTAGPCDTQVQAVDGSGLGSPDAQTDSDSVVKDGLSTVRRSCQWS